MSWSGRVVDALCEAKRAGLDFDTAWRRALKANPLTARSYQEALFTDDPDERSPVEFLRAVAEDAWHGRKPALSHFERVFALEAAHDERRVVRMTGQSMGARAD